MLEVKMGVPVPEARKSREKSELREALESIPIGGMVEVPADHWPNGVKASVHWLVARMNVKSQRKTGLNAFASRSLPNGTVGVWRIA